MATTSENGSVEELVKDAGKSEDAKAVASATVVQGEAQEDWPAPVIATKPQTDMPQGRKLPKPTSEFVFTSCDHLFSCDQTVLTVLYCVHC